jgi:hypothetical protein
MACLEDIQRSAHITFREFQQCLFPVVGQLHAKYEDRLCGLKSSSHKEHALFSLDHIHHSLLHLSNGQWRKPKSRTPTLYSWCDFVDIVTNNAEPDVLRILLDYTTERGLSLLCHHIRFIKDDELVAL